MAQVTVAHLRKVQRLVSEGEWRADVQCKEKWVGAAIAQVLGFAWDDRTKRGIVNKALGTWLASGALVKVSKLDSHRNERTFVEAGEWASD